MSKVTDYVIANASGADVRADINAVLDAVKTLNSDLTEPSNPSAYMLWVDKTLGVLKIRNAANSAWVILPINIATRTIDAGTINEAGTTEGSPSGSGVTIDGLTIKDGGFDLTGTDADGDIYFRNGGALARLEKGTALQELRMNAGATAPEWATILRDSKGSDIVSANPLVIGTGNYFDVTGTTGFASMTVASNKFFILQFDAALTMTHHATNLDLPGEANITTVAGDVAMFFSTGTNTVHCINYTRVDGSPIATASATVKGGVKVGTNLTMTGETLSADNQTPGIDSITQIMLNDNIVGINEIRTSTLSEVSGSGAFTLPGGSYGFYPQVHKNGIASSDKIDIWAGSGTALSATYITAIWLTPDGGSLYAQQRYFTASPPYNLGDGNIPLFMFCMVDVNGLVKNMYTASEAPWHYNGPTNIVGKIHSDGKKYQMRPSIKNKQIHYEKIEVTQAIKNADMGLIPHPFLGETKRIVLIDPVSDFTWELRNLLDAGMSINELFHNGDLVIDNTPLNRKGPKGVVCCTAKWR